MKNWLETAWMNIMWAIQGDPYLIETIRKRTVFTCGFLPSVTSLAAMITLHPGIGAVNAIVHSVCDALHHRQRIGTVPFVKAMMIVGGQPDKRSVYVVAEVDAQTFLIEGEMVDEYAGIRAGKNCGDGC